ncbi:type IVB secretion system protein IcmH/DotU [Pseudomonas sp. 148P]|uniref:Type IVB secretion system protein IcmH/DotU n=1 Tax=Pseudomonas ulcerans TaxID=3115852 RepID=A0ABU7HUJ8_9PSED|nr:MULTISPECIES: type IVB secretion system protein IcmH/DotU [unclassified Pseudomonas]MEE1924027.1 type IVB secretion system protein IcmH/DotU [Pseudomonas sp. 147P]MEE1935210.1 type IVB secretion system protein IcmH/DotU [Pseudomonas sp. 148P]
MIDKDTYDNQDNRTVIVDLDGRPPEQSSLTDFAQAPRYEALESHYVYSARVEPAQTYSISPNPLIAAAADLLSDIVRLKQRKRCKDMDKLNRRLNNDIKAFERRSRLAGVEHYEVQTARYLLCTVVDEAVLNTEWGKHSDWSNRSLLSHFHNETSGGEKFFLLVERVIRRPSRHLHMIELMYLCLSLGFKGKYARATHDGGLALEEVRDDLYRHIRQLRSDTPQVLSAPAPETISERPLPPRVVPWWLVALFTLISLATLYSGFAWVLGEQRDQVLRPFLLDSAMCEDGTACGE